MQAISSSSQSKTLYLTKDMMKTLYKRAETKYPHEAVALLFGKDTTVLRVVLMENVASDRNSSFRLDPDEQYRVLSEAEDDLIGIFHTHKGEPYPSPNDIRKMKELPIVWLIGSHITGKWESKAYDVVS